MGIYRRILLPVDGSPASDRGAIEAVHLARDQAAALLILYVIDRLPFFAGDNDLSHSKNLMDIFCEAGEEIVCDIRTRAHAENIEAQTRVIEAVSTRVADTILEQALEWRADLIVMGTHGRRGITRLYLGSDAELVVRNSPVPVLLVRAEAAECEMPSVWRHGPTERNHRQLPVNPVDDS
jgi:nucleotide-binding universal stress UspA family protein